MKIRLFLWVALVLIFGCLQLFAQYTGPELEKQKPPDLYPQAGPGELAIIHQLEETNRLLTEQKQMIAEQNRLLKEYLNRTLPPPQKVIK
jgi:hypothetical protein